MEINFKWIGAATWILQADDIKIACDPVLCPKGHIQNYKYFKSKRLNSPVFNDNDFQNVNLWLLTHNHEDHIDEYGFKIIGCGSTIISHKSLKPFFNNNLFNNVRFLDWNEKSLFSSDSIKIKIRALPAMHAKKSFISSLIGNGNGYLLEINNNDAAYCIYITGDSVFKKNIKKHITNPKIDLIIANAGSAKIGKSFPSKIIGRITNNINDIKKMTAVLKPKLLIPVHWGTFTHYYELIKPDSFEDHENIKIINPGQSINLK